ncbi:MAG: hypothetical protein Q7K35_06105 [bacterium]|nr:hypothetical protein [bacterium]
MAKNSRFSKLAALDEIVFHTGDAGNLWGIKNSNTLNTTLSRYARQGLIYRLYRGLYSLKKAGDLDPYFMGIKALHGSAYVSCESVLFAGGAINQKPCEITLVSRASRRFTVAGVRFRSRKLHDRFLYNDAGIEIKNGVRYATLERAVADLLYFNPRKHFDATDSNLINWQKVRAIADEAGYEINLKI